MAVPKVGTATPPPDPVLSGPVGPAQPEPDPVPTGPTGNPTIPTAEPTEGGGHPTTQGTINTGNGPGVGVGNPTGNAPKGNAWGYWKNHEKDVPHHDLPIFIKTPFFSDRDEIEYYPEPDKHRNDDDERYWQERSYNASRANVRRGVIRDYLEQNLRTAIQENTAQFNERSGIQQFSRSVGETLARVLNDPVMAADKTLKIIANEVSHLLHKEFNFDVARQSTIPLDRANQMADLLLRHIVKTEIDPGFRNLNSQKVLDGLILLNLAAHPGKNMGDMRKIMGHKPCILPDGMPWSVFRNTGLLAANLMKDGAALRTPSELDAAVRRFVKLLVANNELGVLLAAARLSADARSGTVSGSRVLALVQIYELIGQLLLITERAMREAAVNQKTPELIKSDRGLAFYEAKAPKEAEADLRRYLEFNPNSRADTYVSAFFSEDLAEHAARLAVDSSQRAMEEWIQSGRHRFVNDVDLGKPLGIVIDKATDECFTATTIRIVLVRDASAFGWRMFRSFLVG